MYGFKSQPTAVEKPSFLIPGTKSHAKECLGFNSSSI